jgi:hypothetical protein
VQDDLAVGVVTAEIVSKDKEVAKEAIWCCARFSLRNEKIVNGLCLALKDEELLSATLAAFQSIGPEGKSSAPILIELYPKADQRDRPEIIATLSAVDRESDKCRKLFVSCAADKTGDSRLRLAAIRAIGRLGKSGRNELPMLEQIVVEGRKEDHPRLLQFVAVEAVFRLDPDHKELTNWLCEFLSDPQFGNRQTDTTTVVRDSINMLGALGPRAKVALPLIRKHQNWSPEEDFQEAYSKAIKLIENR